MTILFCRAPTSVMSDMLISGFQYAAALFPSLLILPTYTSYGAHGKDINLANFVQCKRGYVHLPLLKLSSWLSWLEKPIWSQELPRSNIWRVLQIRTNKATKGGNQEWMHTKEWAWWTADHTVYINMQHTAKNIEWVYWTSFQFVSTKM